MSAPSLAIEFLWCVSLVRSVRNTHSAAAAWKCLTIRGYRLSRHHAACHADTDPSVVLKSPNRGPPVSCDSPFWGCSSAGEAGPSRQRRGIVDKRRDRKSQPMPRVFARGWPVPGRRDLQLNELPAVAKLSLWTSYFNWNGLLGLVVPAPL